jgi:hypothetical protein
MTTLPDKTIKRIAERVAKDNKIAFHDILLAPTISSTGAEALEIRFVLNAGSSDAIRGEPSARTVSQVIQQLADKGEPRFPIVRWEERGGPHSS